MEKKEQDKYFSHNWSQRVLRDKKCIILDTETTGLNSTAEIIQIGILSISGETLMDSLFRPSDPIPEEASKIHGIKDEDVKNAPLFSNLHAKVISIIKGKRILIYNAQYDMRLLKQTFLKYRIPTGGLDLLESECVMLKYAAFVGNTWDNGGGYKWPKLTGGDHTAIGDCKATLDVIKLMASPNGQI
jgi:DNA polymerase-3 subunit epsilon